MDTSRVWLVIPAYNEAKNGTIGTTVRGARQVFSNIIVVDDCSRDGTGDLAYREGAHVCRHPVNLGKGAALATGIRYALSEGAEEIVTFDADGQHRIEDVLKMIAQRRSEDADVVLGSRFLGAAPGMSQAKRILLKLAVVFTRLTSGLQVTDAHNGLRVMTRAAASQISIRQNRMAHASEILNEIAAKGLRYSEAPISIIYTDYSVEKGQKMSGAFTILGDLFLRRLHK